jgi:hypothetical protein
MSKQGMNFDPQYILPALAIDFMVVSFFGFVSYKADAMPATTMLRITVVE